MPFDGQLRSAASLTRHKGESKRALMLDKGQKVKGD